MDSKVPDDFANGWKFHIKKMGDVYGKFPCHKFSCSGCFDWLDYDHYNRQGLQFVFKRSFFRFHFHLNVI